MARHTALLAMLLPAVGASSRDLPATPDVLAEAWQAGKQAGRQSPPSIAMHPSHTWFVEEAAPAGGVTWMMMFCDMDTSFGTAGEEGRDFLYTMAGVIDNRHPSRPHAKLVCRFDLRASHLATACLLLLALSIFVCLYPPRAFVRASDLRPLLERSRHDDLSMA